MLILSTSVLCEGIFLQSIGYRVNLNITCIKACNIY